MLKNVHLLAKIGADTAENERCFAKNFDKKRQLPYSPARGKKVSEPAEESLVTCKAEGADVSVRLAWLWVSCREAHADDSLDFPECLKADNFIYKYLCVAVGKVWSNFSRFVQLLPIQYKYCKRSFFSKLLSLGIQMYEKAECGELK